MKMPVQVLNTHRNPIEGSASNDSQRLMANAVESDSLGGQEPMQVAFTKRPSFMRHLDLPSPLYVSAAIEAQTGRVIMVRILNHYGKRNRFEQIDGRFGGLYQGDVIPTVLGARRAAIHYSGNVPAHVQPGDRLWLLCANGLVGTLAGRDEAWGEPLPVAVLGSALVDGAPVDLPDPADGALPQARPGAAPVIAVVGTGMNTGKTTAAARVVHHFARQGRRVAAVKLTGTAFQQDPLRFRDAGARPVRDFLDHGLLSTCIDSAETVVETALDILTAVDATEPDFIVAELGSDLIDEYHNLDILQNSYFRERVSGLVVCANDLTGVRGAKDVISECGLEIMVITGPAVNNKTCEEFVLSKMNSSAESNKGSMPKTMQLVEKALEPARLGRLAGPGAQIE